MIRIASVVAQGKGAVTLHLQKVEKCAGCSGNCDKPLFNLFSLKKNIFTLSQSHQNYQIKDETGLLSKKLSFGQLIRIHISEHDLYTFSGLLYLLPLLLCLLMLISGHYVGVWLGVEADISAAIGLLLGFGLVYFIMKADLIARHLKIRPIVTILDINGTSS